MNVKKLCCLITVTAILFFLLTVTSFAKTDQLPQLSQEELQLVFQSPKSRTSAKPDFLVYLDEQEMKETEGKAGPATPFVVNTIGGAVTGAAAAWVSGADLKGIAVGALSGAAGGFWGTVGGLTGGLTGGAIGTFYGSVGTAAGCYGCHSVK